MKYNRRGESTGRDQYPTAGMKAGGRGRGGNMHAQERCVSFTYLSPQLPERKIVAKVTLLFRKEKINKRMRRSACLWRERTRIEWWGSQINDKLWRGNSKTTNEKIAF